MPITIFKYFVEFIHLHRDIFQFSNNMFAFIILKVSAQQCFGRNTSRRLVCSLQSHLCVSFNSGYFYKSLLNLFAKDICTTIGCQEHFHKLGLLSLISRHSMCRTINYQEHFQTLGLLSPISRDCKLASDFHFYFH